MFFPNNLTHWDEILGVAMKQEVDHKLQSFITVIFGMAAIYSNDIFLTLAQVIWTEFPLKNL